MQTERDAAPTQSTLLWYATWLVPSLIAAFALATIEQWLPAPFPERQATEFLALDQEHDIFCQKYGLLAASTQHAECKAALLKFRGRERPEDLLFF